MPRAGWVKAGARGRRAEADVPWALRGQQWSSPRLVEPHFGGYFLFIFSTYTKPKVGHYLLILGSLCPGETPWAQWGGPWVPSGRASPWPVPLPAGVPGEDSATLRTLGPALVATGQGCGV